MAERKYALKNMTFIEFRERLAEEPVILLPFASQEEQGPHAPMGDYMLTEKLAEMTAARADAIAAPTVPFGYADYFRTIPGGIQLRAETFKALLEDTITAFLDHGIERLVVFNGHTSNAPLIDQTVRIIRKRYNVLVPSINIWQIVSAETWSKVHGDAAARARGHGGDPVSSVYLHLFPDLVRPDLIEPAGNGTAFGLPTAGVGAVTFEGRAVQVPLDVTEINPHGMMGGEPARSTPEIGAALAEDIVGFAERFVRHFRTCDPKSIGA